jgi:YfiH family protein
LFFSCENFYFALSPLPIDKLSMQPIELLCPVWPAPANVVAGITTRAGGISQAPYAGLNLGQHVGDDPLCVASNRAQLEAYCRSDLCSNDNTNPETPSQRWHWLNQTHSTHVATCATLPAADAGSPTEADAAISNEPHNVCVVLTADCLPILLCDRQGTRVGIIHAGWRGLVDGVVDNTITALCAATQQQSSRRPNELFAWLGPAIGPRKFIVGDDVRQRAAAYFNKTGTTFDLAPNALDTAFAAAPDDSPEAVNSTAANTRKYLADIYQLATLALYRNGLKHIYGGGFCTTTDQQRFFSYRRDGVTGRMASFILLNDAVS